MAEMLARPGCVRAPGCWRGWRYPTGPYFPAPRPRPWRHRAARTRVPRMRGALRGAVPGYLVPPARKGKAAGTQPPRGEGPGVFWLDPVLPQGVDAPPLGGAPD